MCGRLFGCGGGTGEGGDDYQAVCRIGKVADIHRGIGNIKKNEGAAWLAWARLGYL